MVTICISSSHPWLPSKRMLMPGTPQTGEITWWEGGPCFTICVF